MRYQAQYREVTVATQEASLLKLAEMAKRGSTHPEIRKVAKIITSSCDSRDDLCELDAIFRAVKEGDSRVPGLENGVRYVSDPSHMDYFTGPVKLLNDCRDGACGEDCDSHTALVCALGAALGFRMGLRAYGKGGSKKEYTHVYPVAALPKHGAVKQIVGLDTTVPSSSVGWEPPKGHVLTAWIDS